MKMSTPGEIVTLMSPDNQQMHPTYLRLLECAREATAGSKHPIQTAKDMYKALDESSATSTNWKKRGVSREGAYKAQKLWGCNQAYVMEAQLPKWVDGDLPPPQMVDKQRLPFMVSAPFTELLQPDTKSISAPVIAWADLEAALMRTNREWPIEAFASFTSVTQAVSDRIKAVTVQESDIASISPGDRIVIDPEAAPWHDCVVLVKMPDGRLTLRRYRGLANGGWEVFVPGEPPMENIKHGLRLVGVVVALHKMKF